MVKFLRHFVRFFLMFFLVHYSFADLEEDAFESSMGDTFPLSSSQIELIKKTFDKQNNIHLGTKYNLASIYLQLTSIKKRRINHER